MPATPGDFYEDDEPIEDILAAWDEGVKGLTGKPKLDVVMSIRFTADQATALSQMAQARGVLTTQFIRDLLDARIRSRQFRCEHMDIGNAQQATCGICGPMREVA